MKKLLSVSVNSIKKAKRICEARKGFYEKFYLENARCGYIVFYRPL